MRRELNCGFSHYNFFLEQTLTAYDNVKSNEENQPYRLACSQKALQIQVFNLK